MAEEAGQEEESSDQEEEEEERTVEKKPVGTKRKAEEEQGDKAAKKKKKKSESEQSSTVKQSKLMNVDTKIFQKPKSRRRTEPRRKCRPRRKAAAERRRGMRSLRVSFLHSLSHVAAVRISFSSILTVSHPHRMRTAGVRSPPLAADPVWGPIPLPHTPPKVARAARVPSPQKAP